MEMVPTVSVTSAISFSVTPSNVGIISRTARRIKKTSSGKLTNLPNSSFLVILVIVNGTVTFVINGHLRTKPNWLCTCDGITLVTCELLVPLTKIWKLFPTPLSSRNLILPIKNEKEHKKKSEKKKKRNRINHSLREAMQKLIHLIRC